MRFTSRDRNKAGPQTNCPENLAKTHRMLRPKAQMAPENPLENVGSLQYLMYKRF